MMTDFWPVRLLYRVLLNFTEFYRVKLSFTRSLQSFSYFQRFLPIFFRVLPSFTEFYSLFLREKSDRKRPEKKREKEHTNELKIASNQ